MMFIVMIDRWGNYGCEEPYMVFHSKANAQDCVDRMNSYDLRDSYTLYEVEVGDE